MQVQKGTQTPLLLDLQWKHSASDSDGTCEGAAGGDNNGNVLVERLQYPSGGVQQTVQRNYGYDGANRLTSYNEPATGKGQGYGYDGFGNLWQTSASGVPDLRPNGPSWYQGSNVQVTNRLSGTVYDAAGNQTQLSISPGGTDASYDAEGRLAQVTLGSTALVTNDYDAGGRRVKRTDANGIATYYAYDADGQLMAEYGGTSTASGTQYLVTDQLGSTRMVLDAQGNCGVRMDYAPYGAVVSRSGQDCYGTPWTSGMMFTGALRDGDTTAGTQTGLDHMGAREYWASLGRFTSPDHPFNDQNVADPGSWNLYTYVRNNSLGFIDLTGRECVTLDNGAKGDDGEGTFCKEVTEANKSKKPDVTVTAKQGSLWAFLTAPQVPRYVPNDRPLDQKAQIIAHELSRRIDTYPTICGGGVYFYAGREISAGPVHGFVGAITEFDSREGRSTGALFEVGGGEGIVGGGGYVATTNRNGQPSGSVLGFGGVGISTPAASASTGIVGFGSAGNVSGIGLYGEGFLSGRGGGGGGYLNITNVGRCR